MQTCTLYSAESCRAAPSRSDARRLCSCLGSEPPAAARQAERVPRAPGACSGAKPTGHLATAARQLSLPSGWFPEKHSGHPGSEPGCARGGGGEIKPGMGTRGRLEGSAKPTGPLNPGRGLATACTTAPRPAGKAPPRRRAVPRSASGLHCPHPPPELGTCWDDPRPHLPAGTSRAQREAGGPHQGRACPAWVWGNHASPPLRPRFTQPSQGQSKWPIPVCDISGTGPVGPSRTLQTTEGQAVRGRDRGTREAVEQG